MNPFSRTALLVGEDAMARLKRGAEEYKAE